MCTILSLGMPYGSCLVFNLASPVSSTIGVLSDAPFYLHSVCVYVSGLIRPRPEKHIDLTVFTTKNALSLGNHVSPPTGAGP